MALVFFAFNITIGQQLSEDYTNGQLFIKIKNTAPIYFPAFEYGEVSKQDSSNFPFVNLKEKYQLESLERPFDKLNEAQLVGDNIIKSLKNTYRLRFSNFQLTDKLIKEIRLFDYVEYVERVPKNELFYTPNDPNLSVQYALTNMGRWWICCYQSEYFQPGLCQ